MAIDINIPSQVKNYANLAGFPATGSLKTIYIAEDTNKTYRWTGSAYVEISASQAASWGTITGTLSSQTDLNTALSGKVPTTRALTINGTTQDLSADRTFTISTGITIGTTAITSGTVGRVLFEGTGNVVSESANLFWDNTNGRLGIGGTPSNYNLDVIGITRIRTSSGNYVSPLIIENTGSASIDFKNVATFIGNRGNASNIDDNTNIGIQQKSNIVNNYASLNFFNSAFALASYIGVQYGNHGASPVASLVIGTANSGAPSEKLRIASTGNVLINTTTDAGFKLDVNGTARVATSILVGGGATTGTVQTGVFRGTFFNDYANSFTIFQVQSNGNASFYQGLAIGTSSNAVASAQVEIVSTTKGFLPPRMTTTQKNAIASPATGLMVYDTTLNLMALYNGTTWTTL